MRKVMLLAAMLAMLMVVAAPALGQDNTNAGDGNVIVDQDLAATIVQECNTIVDLDATGGDAVGGDQAAELTQLQAQEADLKADLDAAQANVAELEAAIAQIEAEGQYEDGGDQLAKLKADLDAAQANVAAIDQELKQVQGQIAAIEQGQVNEGGDVVVGDIYVTGAQCVQIITLVQAGDDAYTAVNTVIGNGHDGNGDNGHKDVVYEKAVAKAVASATAVASVDAACAEAAAYAAAEAYAAGNGAEAYASAYASAQAVCPDLEPKVIEIIVVEVIEVIEVETVVETQYAEEEVVVEEDEDITVLPDTGGASLLTLGAGALLVGGGLLARRIFR